MALWNKLNYTRRLFLWLLAYSLLMVGCFVIFQYDREKDFKSDELNAQLQLINSYILSEIKKGTPVESIALDDFHRFSDMRVSVIDNTGRVIYDTGIDSVPRANHLGREEVAKALKYGSGYTVRRHSESTGETYFYSASKGDNGYIVRTAVPYSVTLSSLLQADYGFLWVMGAITSAMCLLGYFATRRLGLNIMRLNRFAQSAEQGDKIYDTEPFPHDELGDISNHIVRLYAQLQQANIDRDREHKAAIFEQREKERIKKQLTNNINHELKTPVAAIQVCVETLLAHKDLSGEKREEFLQRCYTNTVRLKHLLADVSLITRMDDGGAAITREPLDLSAIITEVVADNAAAAADKGFTIRNDVGRNIRLCGNAPLLASVFQNLIDNAIAYSGGSLITLRIASEGPESVVIHFADNGCGVPQEHLPRIFERFYRIDKGRSRAAGGTGLGLSIVKNAMSFHGGSISARTPSGGGLMFRLTFPTLPSS